MDNNVARLDPLDSVTSATASVLLLHSRLFTHLSSHLISFFLQYFHYRSQIHSDPQMKLFFCGSTLNFRQAYKPPVFATRISSTVNNADIS